MLSWARTNSALKCCLSFRNTGAGGLGARLVRLGIEKYGIREIGVNEQNPGAIGFYRHMGFETFKRSETDGEGNPYPILYMRLGRLIKTMHETESITPRDFIAGCDAFDF